MFWLIAPQVTNRIRFSQRQRNQVVKFVVAVLVLRDFVLGERLSFKAPNGWLRRLSTARVSRASSANVELVRRLRFKRLTTFRTAGERHRLVAYNLTQRAQVALPTRRVYSVVVGE
jgi:hypothetical protein